MAEALIRRYEPGDEVAISRLFNRRYGGSVGSIEITPESWARMYSEGWWNCPSLEKDPDCVQVAVRSGRVAGYAAFSCDPGGHSGEGVVQEVVVSADEADAGLAAELLEHVEGIMIGRGAVRITMLCHEEDLSAWRMLDSAGYGSTWSERSVFMLAVLDLPGLLGRMAGLFAERVAAWGGVPPAGGVTLRSPSHSATFGFEAERVTVGPGVGGEVEFSLSEDALVGLLTGTASVDEAYLDGGASLSVVSSGPLGSGALEFLGALFPRVPRAVLRAHTW